jgi:hypothetical protein
MTEMCNKYRVEGGYIKCKKWHIKTLEVSWLTHECGNDLRKKVMINRRRSFKNGIKVVCKSFSDKLWFCDNFVSKSNLVTGLLFPLNLEMYL